MPSRTTKPPPPPPDMLRDLIRERATSLGLNYEELSRRCGGKPDPESISRYLRGRIALNSRYTSELLRVLGWDGVLVWNAVEVEAD